MSNKDKCEQALSIEDDWVVNESLLNSDSEISKSWVDYKVSDTRVNDDYISQWIPDIVSGTIFVSIASYMDTLLEQTVNSLFDNAEHPERLIVAILDQNIVNQRELFKSHQYGKNIRYIHMDILDTRGVCFARSILSNMMESEDFYMQIDSHMIFKPMWDNTMRAYYDRVSKDYSTPDVVLTAYPHGFTMDDNKIVLDEFTTSDSILVIRPLPDADLEHDMKIGFVASPIKTDAEYFPAIHLAAGFTFSTRKFIEYIPYDTKLYFHGEEQSMFLRAWTRGWVIVHPKNVVCYHQYKIKNNDYTTHHWHSTVDGGRDTPWTTMDQISIRRLSDLVTGKIPYDTPYGLGTERTLDAYSIVSGISYENRYISR